MQLMPDTAARFGVSAETVLEPRANLDAGARYLAFCWARSPAGFKALAARAGEGVVQRLGRIPPYEETAIRQGGARAVSAPGGRVLADGRLRPCRGGYANVTNLVRFNTSDATRTEDHRQNIDEQVIHVRRLFTGRLSAPST